MDTENDLGSQGENLIPSAEFDDLLQKETEMLNGFVPTLGSDELQPMMIVLMEGKDEDGGRKRALLPIQGLTEDADKRQVMAATGAAVAETGVRMVGAFLITEAWTKSLSAAEAWRSKAEPVLPSKMADRQEALVVWGRTVDRRVALAMAAIHRDEATTRLGDWRIQKCHPADETESDNLLSHFFLGFLQEWDRRREQQ